MSFFDALLAVSIDLAVFQEGSATGFEAGGDSLLGDFFELGDRVEDAEGDVFKRALDRGGSFAAGDEAIFALVVPLNEDGFGGRRTAVGGDNAPDLRRHEYLGVYRGERCSVFAPQGLGVCVTNADRRRHGCRRFR